MKLLAVEDDLDGNKQYNATYFFLFIPILCCRLKKLVLYLVDSLLCVFLVLNVKIECFR